MGERLNGIQEVRGSIPLGSTNLFNKLLLRFFPLGSYLRPSGNDLGNEKPGHARTPYSVLTAKGEARMPVLQIDGTDIAKLGDETAAELKRLANEHGVGKEWTGAEFPSVVSTTPTKRRPQVVDAEKG